MDMNLTLGSMVGKYIEDQFKMMSLKRAYEHGGSYAFYGSENEPEKIEGVAIQTDGTPVAWVGRYTRYFSINPVKLTAAGKLKISDYSCGGSAAGHLDIASINKYNATVPESKKIIDWINF